MQLTKFKAFVNVKVAHDILLENDDITIDGNILDWDCVALGNNRFSILSNGKSYDAFVVNINREEKIVELLINNHKYSVQLKDRYDDLLEKLGMNATVSGKLSELKSPMPGMVLKILVKEGDEVRKGDSLIVLEAMKMENMLKAQGNGLVKSIKVQTGIAVDKGALLITFA
jgi:biotin carboxyl carrier protein